MTESSETPAETSETPVVRCIICNSKHGWNCDCIEMLESLAEQADRRARRNGEYDEYEFEP